MRKDFWSADQEKLAREMLDAKVSDAEFFEKVGRTKVATASHFHYRRNQEREKDQDQNSTYAKLGVRAKRKKASSQTPNSVPDSSLLEAAQRRADWRASTARSTTAALCGDPAPGQSALDQRQK
jgi:hypothetical protein